MTAPYYSDDLVTLYHGDCLDILTQLPDNSVSAVVTDPPYGLSTITPDQLSEIIRVWSNGERDHMPEGKGFMGKSWDAFVPPPAVWDECLRVLKPGGYMAVFAGTRTQDLMGLSIRLAGFEIRDTLGWIYGSGFPKSMDVSKAIDKAAGAERAVVGVNPRAAQQTPKHDTTSLGAFAGTSPDLTAPATPEAERWSGWGTALKPAIEPIILARKPLDGTVAANVLAHGVGGLNIDACRVEAHDSQLAEKYASVQNARARTNSIHGKDGRDRAGSTPHTSGRFPANVLLDEHAAAEMDRQSGVSVSRAGGMSGDRKSGHIANEGGARGLAERGGHDARGGASRFFPVFKYQAKAPKKERPVIVREDGTKIAHPTVKPVALMEWLITLITPPGGVVLEPFAGSGTTLEAAMNLVVHAIGVEREPDYCELIAKRLSNQTMTFDFS